MNHQTDNVMEDQKLKKIMYALAAIAVVLAGVLAYIWYDKYTVEKELESEKADLIGQLNTLNDDYASLSSDYEDVNMQLDSSRLEVQLLIEKLTKTEATNRAKIRQYEKELGTLRTVMRGYVKQIDSLHSLNRQLTADAAQARREAAENRRRSEELSKTVESLSGQVAAGAVIKARGLRAEAYNASDKVTDRSSRVKYILTSLCLVENDLAEKGPVTVYVRVKDPEGMLLLNGTQKAFEYNGETMICSASREVDYQGADVELGIYLNDITEYAKGIYTVEAFTSQAFLGSAELMLR